MSHCFSEPYPSSNQPKMTSKDFINKKKSSVVYLDISKNKKCVKNFNEFLVYHKGYHHCEDNSQEITGQIFKNNCYNDVNRGNNNYSGATLVNTTRDDNDRIKSLTINDSSDSILNEYVYNNKTSGSTGEKKKHKINCFSLHKR